MDDQSKLQKRTAKSKWGLSCFRKPDRQPRLPNSIPPDAEPSNPIPPDAEALSQPQSSFGEEEAPNPIPLDAEALSQPQSSFREEEALNPIPPDAEALSQPQSSSGEEEASISEEEVPILEEEEEAPIPEENREEKKEELHPEWPKMDERLEKILEEESTRLLDSELNQLTPIQRKCLLCFSVFEPNSKIKKQNMNSEINKQNMIYWWIGEGFAKPSHDKTAEEDGEQIFQQLVERGFIEPIRNSCTDTIHECRVQPFVHWMVKKKARDDFFCDLDERGKPSAKLSRSSRLCLTSETKPSLSSSGNSSVEVTVMFNVSKQSYRSQFYEFPINFKSLVVLQLGRWSSNAKYHIEVEGFENLKNIGLLTNLRYLGLQGLSRLTNLPPEIKKLKCLLILDLRGCQYLEKVGKDVTYLERLTRLDLTECYMLEHIATGFGSLSELQVFKGFVFGGSRDSNRCRLAELRKLTKLRKLSINITSEANINNNEMNVLSDFPSLQSLTITWGAIPKIGDSETNSILEKWKALELPPKIEKFDMRCFPCAKMPNWGLAGARNLKRLYIRGGELQTLRPENGSSETAILYLNIERLRLKYLAHFDMEWADIREMMPNLDRLEFVECGQLRSPPPLDQNHVWIRDKKDEENDQVPPIAPSPTTPETAPDETAMGDDATEATAAAFDEEITTEPGTAAASNEETTAEPALHQSPTNEATAEIVAASKEEEEEEEEEKEEEEEEEEATAETVAASMEETTTKPDLHGSSTNEATTETFAASKEENIIETTHRQTPTDETSRKFVDEIITAEPALQDLSAASTSAVANTTNNSSTNATIETPSNPGVVPATSPGTAIGDEEGPVDDREHYES